MSYPPISAYGLLSECHSAALSSPDGSVDWCCFNCLEFVPRFDDGLTTPRVTLVGPR